MTDLTEQSIEKILDEIIPNPGNSPLVKLKRIKADKLIIRYGLEQKKAGMERAAAHVAVSSNGAEGLVAYPVIVHEIAQITTELEALTNQEGEGQQL